MGTHKGNTNNMIQGMRRCFPGNVILKLKENLYQHGGKTSMTSEVTISHKISKFENHKYTLVCTAGRSI